MTERVEGTTPSGAGGVSELDLIDALRRRVGVSRGLKLGIGDDAAWLETTGGAVVTTDMLLQGTHFRLTDATWEQIGHKAVAVNLSDLAAMAARPVGLVVCFALPEQFSGGAAEALFAAVANACERFGVALAGGDTTVWPFPLAIAATAIGEPGPGGLVRRSGARPGDRIFVTGALGGSLFGHHLTFVPRVAEAVALASAVPVHAMCDVSDGLAIDLHRIAQESGVGAVIEAAAIPIRPEAAQHANGRSPLDHALSDGEDFELLFCVAPEDAERLQAAPPFETPLTQIGEITAGRDVLLKLPDGRLQTLPRAGWQHVLPAARR